MSWIFFTLVNVFGNGTALFAYKIAFKRLKIGVYSVMFASFLFASIFYLPVFFYISRNSLTFFSSSQGVIFFLISIIGNAFAIYLNVLAIKSGELSVVGPLENLRPFFVVLFSLVFLKEIPSAAVMLGTSLIVIGAMVLHFKKDFSQIYQSLGSKVSKLMLASTALYGLVAVVDKRALEYIGPAEYAFMFLLGLSVVYAGLAIKEGGRIEIQKAINKYSLIIGFLMMIGIFGIFQALKLASPNLVIPLQMTRSLYLALLGFLVFKEKGYFKKIVAALIMLSGVVLIVG